MKGTENVKIMNINSKETLEDALKYLKNEYYDLRIIMIAIQGASSPAPAKTRGYSIILNFGP